MTMKPSSEPRRGYQRLEQFTANPRRALWTLSIPVIVGSSIQTLYMLVDMFFVGRVGPAALTALAFNTPLMFVVMGVTFGLGSGITALVAQAIGARDEDQANWAAEHAVVLGALVTVFFTVGGLLGGRFLLALLGVPPELSELAWSYFAVIAGGYVFMVMSIFLRSILTGEGEVKIPVMFQVAGTVLNVVLDPLFIFTFGLGVQGAAIATVASQALVATAFGVLFFGLKRSHVEMDLRRFRWRGSIAGGIVRIGMPASLSFLVMGLGVGVYNRILIEVSADAVAAQQIGLRLDHVAVLPIVSISYSVVTLVGMFYGARRYDLLRSIVFYAVSRSMLITSGVSLLFFVFAPELASIFTDSEEIRRLTTYYLRTIAFAYPFFPFSMIAGRALQGLGKGTPELILSSLRVILVGVPLACVIIFWLDLEAHYMWYALVLGSWTSAAVAALWLRSALRRLI